MLVYKSFRYRVYPTTEQVARLSAWEDALRFLWNLANEQRLIAYGRSDRRYPTAFDQINELTKLRAALAWLADVPRDVCAQLLVELDKAWQFCFKKIHSEPLWKRKGRALSVTEPHPKAWWLSSDAIHFPKLGTMRAVVHRSLEGKPKSCTIKRDGGQWFASICCEVEVNSVPNPGPAVGLDRGIVVLVADSNGKLNPNPRWMAAAAKRLARAQREVCRRKKGSKNQDKSKANASRLHRTIRRQRSHAQHALTTNYAKSHGLIVVEDLHIKNMVKANRGLARSIHDAAWGRLDQMLRYKTCWYGGQHLAVPAAYSSQTCAACGHVDAASRISQEQFVCTSCGVAEHADVNAAKVILQRGLRAVESTATVCGGSGTSRPAKQKLRVARRGTRSI